MKRLDLMDAGGAYLAVSIEAANARPNHPSTSQRGQPTNHMDYTTTSKVNDTDLEEQVFWGSEGRRPALGVPHPCSNTCSSQL